MSLEFAPNQLSEFKAMVMVEINRFGNVVKLEGIQLE